MSDESNSNPEFQGGAIPPGNSSLRTLLADNDRKWVSLRQFVALFGVTYHTGMRWRKEKRFICTKVGGQYRIYEEELRHILDNGTRPPQKPDNPGED